MLDLPKTSSERTTYNMPAAAVTLRNGINYLFPEVTVLLESIF